MALHRSSTHRAGAITTRRDAGCTGSAQHTSGHRSLTLNDLGKAERITVERDNTPLVGGAGKKAEINRGSSDEMVGGNIAELTALWACQRP